MAILNKNLKFHQLDTKHRNAFASASGDKILLPAGTSLFRFSGHSNISGWWSETSDLLNLLTAAKSSGQDLGSHIRNTTAVLRIWDYSMQNLIVATLKRSVYAFAGKIASQNEAARYMDPEDPHYKEKFTKPVFFKGGNSQVYISGLTSADLRIVVPAGVVFVYDKIDEIIDFLINYKVV